MSALPKSPLGTPPPPNLNVTAAPQQSVEPASADRRLVALIIDGVIVSVAQIPLGLVMAFVLSEGPMYSVLSNVMSWFSIALYSGWFCSHKGATPGKLVMGLRVLEDSTGTYLSFQKAFMRELAKLFLGIVTFCISYLMAHFRKDKRALHDIVMKTRVVRVIK